MHTDAPKVLRIDMKVPPSPAKSLDILDTLENGGILFLEHGFQPNNEERKLISNTKAMLPTEKERKSKNGRPTVVLDPVKRKLDYTRIKEPHRSKVIALLSRYSRWALSTIAQLVPTYRNHLITDRVTFRPCLRSKTQGLHVDSSYGRPTEGRGMLRIFTNVNTNGESRRWQVGEPFEQFATRFLPQTSPRRPHLGNRLLEAIGATKGKRTAYDLLMSDLRALVKIDADYQAEAVKGMLEFPAGSSWIAISDRVLHGALAGQNSLDQTFFLPHTAMDSPDLSTLCILERLTGRDLIDG